MRLRRLAPLPVLVLGALPASAAAVESHVSTTAGNEFKPPSITIAPGDTAVFHNGDGGFHNVKFDDGQFEQPADPSPSWPARVARTFPTAGKFTYQCEQHGPFGMKGTILVAQPGGGGGGGGPTVTPPPTIEKLKLKRRRAGGISVALDASVASSAKVTLARRSRGRFRKVRSLTRSVGSKATTITFKRGRGRKRLKPGRYRVTVQLTAKGVKGTPKSRRITLR